MKIKDERLVQVTNKILSEAYYMVLFLLATSVFVKSYLIDLHYTQYAVELGIIVLSMIYIGIRSMLAGGSLIDTSTKGKILTISAVLLLSLAVSVMNGVRNYSMYGDRYAGVFDGRFIAVLVVTFISALVLISAVLMLFNWLNKKGQQRIEKKMNDDKGQD